MSRATSKSTSSSRRGSVKFTVTIVTLCLVQLLSAIHPASSIGGWETIHILMNRLSPQRSQSDQQNSSQRSGSSKIAPVPNGGGKNSDKKDGEGGASKKHVGEVTMTSNKRTSSGNSGATGASDAPAFVPHGRRGGMQLDENDLRTITFVGRTNPFL